MAKIGYMRVSSEKQDHALQYEALTKAGCDKIYEDKISGKKNKRPGLDLCLSELKPGDTFVVWKLDRLGRRMSHLSKLIEDLAEKKIVFTAIMDNFDTSTASGRGMLGMMIVFAQMEREQNSERVVAGLAVRKAEGGKLGPPFKILQGMKSLIYEYDSGGMSQSEIASRLKISQASVSRILRNIK